MNVTTFRAFKSRNYRLYFTGQSVSLIGTWMQRTSVYWLVYVQTQSNFMLGLAVFTTQFPSFLFSLLGGVVSDRYNHYKVLIGTQVASMIQAALLTVLILTDDYNVWQILGLNVLLGVINAFDVPARQSLVYEMVDDKEDLSNAIALNSSMVNLARILGPAVAGITLESLGAGMCFMMNTISFAAVILSLLVMKLREFVPHTHTKKMLEDLKEGYEYLKQTPSIAFILLFLACTSFFVLPFASLMPVYAKVIFKGDATIFGYLNSCIGLGAIAGTIFLASLKPDVNHTKVLFINTLLFGIGLMLFSNIDRLPFAMIFAVLTGFGMMSQVTICNTIIQIRSLPEMRGRVISYLALAFFGMQPLGSLLIGGISHYIGAPNTLFAEGVAALLIAVIFSYVLQKDIRGEKN